MRLGKRNYYMVVIRYFNAQIGNLQPCGDETWARLVKGKW